MGYRIKFVGDDVMPEGHDFLFIETPCGAVILYRSGAVTPAVLEDSWAAYRALGARQTPPSPTRMSGPRKGNPLMRVA